MLVLCLGVTSWYHDYQSIHSVASLSTRVGLVGQLCWHYNYASAIKIRVSVGLGVRLGECMN